ncbi:1-acyl-sn-glycerol-3-phosphate acyltransferase [Lactobacillus sp.]|uniref:lysophospholipid acyltransferase family protein n=1 Tax=Lactobacillus sp. TaxID=1591 RepID=UPI0019A7FF16|nr:1-acyl-sn-glycerol-3-phosphate acyltransferase [Lactobacillus sp.]MBD5429401.1 1-acyl-sn-glycerol-3-phosphate acyltransferase [Lactobacillus sp.]MBD5430835.1 1-acyl-sn-glycerol-3-phosphate acyltransferase [Lactobacillus sp.]
MHKQKIYYYHKLTDDLVESDNQNFSLNDNYQIINQNFPNKIVRTLAGSFAYLLSYGILHVKVVGKEKLVPYKHKGYFVFANHTQPINDAFMPLTLLGIQDYYALASQSNWGIPFIGKYLLPYGGLPVGKDLKQNVSLLKAIKLLIKQNKHIVIYPEAHVWPYYTKIRPFPTTSMNFPVTFKTPSFTMTTTYQKRKHSTKPKIIVYIDGPFFTDEKLPKKQQQMQLHEKIYQQLKQRAATSNCSLYHYQKK